MSEALVSELVELLGEDGYFVLVERYPGLRTYIPENIELSQLADHVGMETALRLSKRYGNDTIKVPVAREFRALKYKEAGMGNREIALRLGMSESGVEKLLKRGRRRQPGRGRKPKDTYQLDLFE